MARDLARYTLALLAASLGGGLLHAQAPGGSTLDLLLDTAQRALTAPSAPVVEATESTEAIPTPAPEKPRFTVPLVRSVSPIDVHESDGLISLSVRDATLRQVLSALAETQDLNLVVAAPADAPVTAEFKKRPLREVLSALLGSTGHTWTEHAGVLVVTSVSAGGDLSPGMQGRRVAVIELDFASSSDLQPAVESLLSPVGHSHFLETDKTDNRRTKELLIVEDLDQYVTRIEQYVSEADQAPRQVLIEVNLLQVDLEDDERCGVDFNALSRVAGASLTLGTSGLASAYNYQGLSPGFFVESTGGDLGAVIEALIATTDAKALASPRLMAVNGQESQIQIGERLGYRVTTTTETSSLESVEFLEVGVVLSITPRITRDGRVLLRVSPKVSSGAVNPDTGVPDEETTELHTDALLNSGQGMIIGGLIQEQDITQINRIPLLGSLPYVNGLFRRRTVEKRRSELIVALAPHVLPYSDHEVHCRNEREFARTREPLTYGPLCRNPRPYEPRLYDPYYDERRLECLDRKDPLCCDPGLSSCVPATPAVLEGCTDAEGDIEYFSGELDAEDEGEPTPTIQLTGLRRLPPTADDGVAPLAEPIEVATRPGATFFR